MILKEGMNPRVVFLPDGDDPDSYSRKHTLEEIRDFISQHEQDGIAFKTQLLLQEAGDDPLKKANLINEIADTVADIPDAIKRQVYIDTVSRQFGIEADIIQDRVRKTRGETTRRDRSIPLQPVPVQEAETPVRQSLPSGNILEPSERELLGFILQDGCSPLRFESDSEFYDADNVPTVAEFIDAAFAADDIHLSLPAFEATYQAWFQLYDEGKEQQDILMALLNGEDREIAAVVADLSTEKYELTVHNFTDALTTHDSWLVTYVPRAILAYHDKRLSAAQKDITRQLATAEPEQVPALMARLGKLNEMKKTINIKLGRLKK